MQPDHPLNDMLVIRSHYMYKLLDKMSEKQTKKQTNKQTNKATYRALRPGPR